MQVGVCMYMVYRKCLLYVLTWVVYQGIKSPHKRNLSGIKWCVGLSQIHMLLFGSCAIGSLFKEDVCIKANPEIQIIFLAFMIHFLNGKFS